jgi:hypothetical protein
MHSDEDMLKDFGLLQLRFWKIQDFQGIDQIEDALSLNSFSGYPKPSFHLPLDSF